MKVSVRRRLRANLLMSTCTSVQLMRLGVGTKESPRDSTLISESESCTVERLMTVLLGLVSCVLFLGAGSSVLLMDIMRVDCLTTCSRSVHR